MIIRNLHETKKIRTRKRWQLKVTRYVIVAQMLYKVEPLFFENQILYPDVLCNTLLWQSGAIREQQVESRIYFFSCFLISQLFLWPFFVYWTDTKVAITFSFLAMAFFFFFMKKKWRLSKLFFSCSWRAITWITDFMAAVLCTGHGGKGSLWK